MTDDRLTQCHAAMDDAENENSHDVLRWSEDRLRLVARDRATLRRHSGAHQCQQTNGEPCPDVEAVLNYWLGETA